MSAPETTATGPERSAARRSYLSALAVLLVGAAVMLIGYGLVWARLEVPLLVGADLGDGAVRIQEVTGRDLYPGAAAMGWLAVASVAGIIATRSWGRVAVAVIGAVSGATGAAVCLVFAVTSGQDAVASYAEALGGSGDVAASATPMWLVALAGALAVLLGALWTVIRGRAWPAMGRRYERGGRRATKTSAWDALDQGEDPTDDLVE